MDKLLNKYGFRKVSDYLWILRDGEKDKVRVSLSYERGFAWSEKAGNFEYREWVVTVYERKPRDLFLTKAVMYSTLNKFEQRFVEYANGTSLAREKS